jgi:methylthioribose-1-phosphate isomerase
VRAYVSAVNPIQAVRWAPDGNGVRIIDQRQLPGALVERDLRTIDDLRDAILALAVRGAPAIGIAAAMGVASLAARMSALRPAEFHEALTAAAEGLRATRPTAVNLGWALDRMLARAREIAEPASAVALALRAEANAILDEDREMCERIGEHGLALIHDGARVLTHCNAGALATAGLGTALAPVYVAVSRGRRVEVIADETRPLLQGSRLTAWELSRAGIPVTVIVDAAAASEMKAGRIDCCLVGADRIAANGDAANKIGTYAVAVAAQYHGIPFYVAAPSSTIDPSTPTGDAIRIEQRAASELSGGGPLGGGLLPDGVAVRNPAFDVTPAALITAIITDRGVHRPPYDFSRTLDAEVRSPAAAIRR